MNATSIEQPTRPSTLPALLLSFASLCLLPESAYGIDGSNDVFFTVPEDDNTGWKTFEILTGGDPLGTLAQEGFAWNERRVRTTWDGLGAYRQSSNTLRVFINHEVYNSSFTRVDLNISNVRAWIATGIANNTSSNQVSAPGPIVTAVSQGWLSMEPENSLLNNPCSGNVWMADTFGPNLGFSDTLYLMGEEISTGNFWVMNPNTRMLYECPDLGQGEWTNASIIDTGRTDTIALLLAEDEPDAPLRLYVGEKIPAGNFLERNGLSNGTTYYWDPEGDNTNGTSSGFLAGGNGSTISGAWVENPENAALFFRLEDTHTNMSPASSGFGVEAAVASQGVAVLTLDFSQLTFVTGALSLTEDSGTSSADSPLTVLFAQGTQVGDNPFSGMDSLVWSADGNIYVNEDDGEGDIWKIDVESLKASYALSDFTPDASQVFDILDANNFRKSSGIIDISEHIGYTSGSVFLTNGQNNSLANNQLALLVSPQATSLTQYSLTYSAGNNGSISGPSSQLVASGYDGFTVTAVPDDNYYFVKWSDGLTTASRTDKNIVSELRVTATFDNTTSYEIWISNYPSLGGFDILSGSDPDKDGIVNIVEYANNLDPTINDWSILSPGTGNAGLPFIETRTIDNQQWLVIEYIRRRNDPNLVYTPRFSSTLADFDLGTSGGAESVTPVNDIFERVVLEDSMGSNTTPVRFGQLQFELLTP